MKTLKFLALTALFTGFVACSSDDDNGQQLLEVEAETVTNLYAPQESDYTTNPPTITGDFIKFSFSSGTTVTGDNWDIAFRGTTILTNGGVATAEGQPERTGNGGAYIEASTFVEVTTINNDLFNQDSSTEGLAIQGWYDYDPTNHVISPTAGRILVIKTHDGKYAKVEILSYYENGEPNAETAPTNYQYYTFNYAYQPNDGLTTF
ncbi:MAG TPA: HmuY family protein [Flavobacteriaceae bacterium]|nr:HmuY family protein [Flavobacteriaceae bacterium]